MAKGDLFSMPHRFPHAIAQGPNGDYIALPIYAFNPIYAGQVDETYPLVKQYGVIATGTKTECKQGLRLIEKERRLTGTWVPLDRALEIIAKIADGHVQARDWSKCHRCFGEGSVYVNRMKLRCPLCGGNGRGMR